MADRVLGTVFSIHLLCMLPVVPKLYSNGSMEKICCRGHEASDVGLMEGRVTGRTFMKEAKNHSEKI